MADCKTCETSSLFASTREARLEAIAKAKREEQARKEQIERLNAIRQTIAVNDAKEQARFQALQEAEKEFKIRERDILEKQLEETIEMSKRMQEQYQEFVVTTNAIAEKLANPAMLFKTATIKSADEFKDYFKLTYEDGRVLNIPMGLIDFVLKSKLDAINTMFDLVNQEHDELAKRTTSNEEQVTKLADLFKTLVANIATHETDQQVAFEKFKCEVKTKVDELTANVNTIAESFAKVVATVDKQSEVLNSLVKAN